MPATQEQLARLMGGISLRTRAATVGVKPENKAEMSVFKAVESANNASREVTVPAITDSRIAFDNAPRTREESGLIAEGMVFDESQMRALDILVRGHHVCLIGAAGTGKTTMVRHALGLLIYGDEEMGIDGIGIRRLAGEQGPSIGVCAFTGIATQVVRAMLPEWLHPACQTIHSLLEYKPVQAVGNDTGRNAMFVPTRTATNKLDKDIIIIDEASMLGLDLWHNIVDALRPNTRIILIGDLNQLKPVADATMFAYALSAGLDKKFDWDLAELTTIHRQKEAAANKIIEGAHAILNGQQPAYDDPQTNADWRFINYDIPTKAAEAHMAIVSAIKFMKDTYIEGESRVLFDPYKDLLLCAGNGYDENNSASMIQQAPLNGTLSRLIEPPSEEHPIYIIDAGRESRKFAVGHRVMATKNESPDMKDRVTNGLTGRIINIESNSNWHGNKAMFGTEKEVLAFRSAQAKIAFGNGAGGKESAMGVNLSGFSLAQVDSSYFSAEEKQEERQASHVITVRYNNGAERTYRSAIDVSSVMLAYAITTHKAQGSQADTVVIVVHHAVKSQLSREWLYTAVTRARRRVILLSTRMGMSVAVNRQQIFGKTMREKVNRYRQAMNSGNQFVRLNAYNAVLEGTVDRFDAPDLPDEEKFVEDI